MKRKAKPKRKTLTYDEWLERQRKQQNKMMRKLWRDDVKRL